MRITVFHLCLLAMAALGPDTSSGAESPKYDLILKGEHVIDPANRINGLMDVATAGDRIAAVEKNISSQLARRVVLVTVQYPHRTIRRESLRAGQTQTGV